MTDEIKPETIKKTQELLGKFIKKPVLTEKLLTKPPFRFLHDICTAAMRETGFFEGVLTSNDCKADSIKDKDGKIAFLQKVIAAVEAANGIKLAVKPNKVVAGHEPTRTNEFLQALAKALEKQNQGRNETVTKSKTDTSRKQEKTVESKAKTKTVKRPEKEETTLKKKTSSTKLAKSDNKTQDSKSKSSEKTTPRSKQDVPKKSEKPSPKEQEIVSDKQEPDEDEKAVKRRERSKLKTPSISNESSELSADNKPKEKPEQTDEKVEPEQTENKRPVSAKPGHRKPLTNSNENVVSPESSSSSVKEPEPDQVVSKTPEAPTKRPDSSFSRINKQNSSPPNYVTKDSAPVDDSSPVTRPLTGMRPTTARPASARPAAPRIRDRGEISVHEDVIKQSTGNVQIITDKNETNETEEDENVVVVEPEIELISDEPNKTDQSDSVSNGLNQGEHGLLVEQILETQKELDQSRQQIMDNKKIEIEWKTGRNREASEREIKKLRLSIQALTRSTNPLGKLLDFLQEDVDIMQKELTNWQEMNAKLDVQIAEERSLTDQSVEPLKIHLKELQQSIDEQLEHMIVVKGSILRNDEKIHRLLTDMK